MKRPRRPRGSNALGRVVLGAETSIISLAMTAGLFPASILTLVALHLISYWGRITDLCYPGCKVARTRGTQHVKTVLPDLHHDAVTAARDVILVVWLLEVPETACGLGYVRRGFDIHARSQSETSRKRDDTVEGLIVRSSAPPLLRGAGEVLFEDIDPRTSPIL